MGSVKDLEVIKEPTEKEMGEGIFTFSDRYSVFDYGVMPDEIKDKGKALCLMAAHNFEKIKEQGLKTHFISLEEDNKMKVRIVRKIQPENLSPQSKNCMVPLEIIFRDALPEGSSVFRRIKKGETTWQDLGLNHEAQPGEKLEKSIIDFSTKFERIDRYFKNMEEVIEYTRLGKERIEELKKQALLINNYLREKAKQLNWEHLDGKVEAAIDNEGNIMWVDVFGTLDEDRFELNGFRLSKQLLRNYYKKTPWYEELQKAKENKLPEEEWPKPPKLPEELVEFVSNIYKAACNEWTGKKYFEIKALKELIEEDYEKLKEKNII